MNLIYFSLFSYSLAEEDDSVEDLFLRLFVAKRMDQLQAVKNILTLGKHFAL